MPDRARRGRDARVVGALVLRVISLPGTYLAVRRNKAETLRLHLIISVEPFIIWIYLR
jgi:hypothetical protein